MHPDAAPGISVNLSIRQLREGDLVEQVSVALRTTELDPSSLTLEITEHLLAEEPRAYAATLAALTDLGVRLALDDFGTGFSSLAYLRELTVDALKLDRAFVRGLGDDRRGQVIVESVADLARALGMEVTAEGIETADELMRVRAAGLGLGQGFYFAPALPAAEIGGLLARNEPFDVLRNVRPVAMGGPLSPRRRRTTSDGSPSA